LLAGAALVAPSSLRGRTAAADVAAAALAALTIALAPAAADWRRLAYSFGMLLAPTLAAVGGTCKQYTLPAALCVTALARWVHWMSYDTDNGATWSVIGALLCRVRQRCARA
jgi:hypothetical protein